MKDLIRTIDATTKEFDNHINSITKKKLEEKFSKKFDIDEEKIRDIARFLICDKQPPLDSIYSANELIYEIIKLTKCDVSTADIILGKMIELGLGVCKDRFQFNFDGTPVYDFICFASMRGYVSEEEEDNFYQRQKEFQDLVDSEILEMIDRGET